MQARPATIDLDAEDVPKIHTSSDPDFTYPGLYLSGGEGLVWLPTDHAARGRYIDELISILESLRGEAPFDPADFGCGVEFYIDGEGCGRICDQQPAHEGEHNGPFISPAPCDVEVAF